MLRLVAYEMQAGDTGLKGNAIDAGRLTQVLTNYLKDQGFSEPREKANLLIDQLRHRNFILCDRGSDIYGFVHRTFLEYFCAVEIVHRFEKQRTLTFEQLRDEVFGQHWQDETWHEVLKLICGAIDVKFAGELIEFLMTRECDLNTFLVQSAYDEIYLDTEGLTNLLLATNCLSEIVKSTEISDIRDRLLRLLQQQLQGSKTILGRNATNSVAYCIAQNFPNTLEWLKEQAKQDHRRIPWAVTWAIGRNFSDNPDTLPWLKEIIRQDNYRQAREAAAWVLACSYSKDPDTLALLKERIQKDEDSFVRRAAIAAIGVYFSNHSETFDLLNSVVKDDPFIRQEGRELNPRHAALEALLTHYPTHPKTLELLRDRAENDPDEQLREWAQKQLKVQNVKLKMEESSDG